MTRIHLDRAGGNACWYCTGRPTSEVHGHDPHSQRDVSIIVCTRHIPTARSVVTSAETLPLRGPR